MPPYDIDPGTSIDALAARYDELAGRLAGPAGGEVAEALEVGRGLFEVCRRLESDPSGTVLAGRELGEIADHGMQVLAELSDGAARRGLAADATALEDLALPLALWAAGRGGELRRLEPAVNALARLANHLSEPHELGTVADAVERLVAAVAPPVRQDMDDASPQRPWRVLLLDWGIVATRSHDPARMERAFAAIVSHLPADAPAFFAEGMQQMQALAYPLAVREVLARYYEQWNERRDLH